MSEVKYYTSIVDLPLSKFIDCLIDKNLFALVITGEPSKEDLAYAWDDILMEYNDAMGDSEGKMHLRLFKEVHELLGNIGIINISIELMKCRYNKQDADDLNRLTDAKFKFDLNDPKKYLEELQRCGRRAKSLELNYALKKSQLDALEKTMVGEQKKAPDRKYFANLLISLTDHSGVRLNAADISVYEFCERIRRFGEYIKELEKQKKK